MRTKSVNYFRDNTNLFLYDTHVENLFINEYMPRAKGDHVKVFLLALMYADSEIRMDNELIASQLGLEVEEVLAAWTFWEKAGAVRKHFQSSGSKLDYIVEFINLKQMMVQGSAPAAAKKREAEQSLPEELKDTMSNDRIRQMYAAVEKIAGRTLEARELTDILSWVEQDKMEPELITKTYEYCVDRKGNNKYKYVLSFIKMWRENEITTPAQMEKYLEDSDQRHYQYKRILKALGLHRHPTEEEKRLMDEWFDRMSFGMETILDACKKTSGISNPNINYVNSILKNWNNERTGGTKEQAAGAPKKPQISSIIRAYEQSREKNKQLMDSRRAEIYAQIPRIKEIEGEIADQSIQISRLTLSKGMNKRQEIDEAKKLISRLTAEKAGLLTDHNFMYDYLEPIYDCKKCKDTGTLDTGERCTCFAEKLNPKL